MRADLFCNLTAKIVRGYAKVPHSHDKNQMSYLFFSTSSPRTGRLPCANNPKNSLQMGGSQA